MTVLETICVAFGMFSRIPVPRIEWNEKNMRYMLCAFPLVGALIGILLWGWTFLCQTLSLGGILYAAGVTLLPLAVTGGIHMDGFCDVCDALASHSGPERRREILKDPHSGAFAVVGTGAYLLLYFALASELSAVKNTALLLTLFHFLSRTLSGLTALSFPSAGKPGLLTTFRGSAEKKRGALLLLAMLLPTAVMCVRLFHVPGAAALAAALIAVIWLRVMCARSFGGMSGDLSGWFLQVCELLMLAAYIFTFKAVA